MAADDPELLARRTVVATPNFESLTRLSRLSPRYKAGQFSSLSMEFDVLGVDRVAFGRAATTREDKAAVRTAKNAVIGAACTF